jgi:hypothetical protein
MGGGASMKVQLQYGHTRRQHMNQGDESTLAITMEIDSAQQGCSDHPIAWKFNPEAMCQKSDNKFTFEQTQWKLWSQAPPGLLALWKATLLGDSSLTKAWQLPSGLLLCGFPTTLAVWYHAVHCAYGRC